MFNFCTFTYKYSTSLQKVDNKNDTPKAIQKE